MSDAVPLTDAAIGPREDRPRCRALIVVLGVASIGLGALHALHHRHAMDADGISYLDLASAYLRGDWDQVVNGYWSPLYSWLLALGLWVFEPSPAWDAGVAHLVNFGIYCAALVAFHFMWMGLWRLHRQEQAGPEPDRPRPLPDWAWFALGYALFLWVSLNVIGLQLVTPDLATTVFLYLIVGVMLRIRMGASGYGLYALLGLLIGLAYLNKLFVLMIGGVFLLLALRIGGPLRRTLPRVIVSAIVLTAAASPWVYALSKDKGRLTLGDSGRLNYVYFINGLHPWDHWHGLPEGTGTPAHPTREHPVRTSPEAEEPIVYVYEFAEPIGGSYPVWYEPTYWFEGGTPSFNWRGHLAALDETTPVLFDVIIRRPGGFLFCIIALLLLRGRWRSTVRDFAGAWLLWLPAAAGLGLYAIIHAEPRLIGGFVLLMFGAMLYAVRMPDREGTAAARRPISIAALLALTVAIVYPLPPMAERLARDIRYRTDTAPHPQWKIAEKLHDMGIHRGDRVAHVGQALKSWSYWARLAGVTIVAETRPADGFWLADDDTQEKVLNAFADAGAKAVITRRMRTDERRFGLPLDFAPGWQRIGGTDFYIRFLHTGNGD